MGTKDGARRATKIREERRAARKKAESQPPLIPPPQAEEPEPAAAPGDEGAPRTVVGGDKDERKRIGIPVNEDGSIAVDALTDKAKARLVKMFNDPAVQSLGVKTAAAAESLKVPVEFFQKAMLIGIGTLDKLAIVAALRSGYPIEEANRMKATPTEQSMLAELGATVLDEWCPPIEGKYQSLALFAAGLASVYGSKFAELKKPGDVVQFPQAVPDNPESVS